MVCRRLPHRGIMSQVTSNAQSEDPVEPSRLILLCGVCKKAVVMEGIVDCETCRSRGSDAIVPGGLLLRPRVPSPQLKQMPKRMLKLAPRLPSPMPDPEERRSGPDDRAAGGVVRSRRTPSPTPSATTPTGGYISGSDPEDPPMPQPGPKRSRSMIFTWGDCTLWSMAPSGTRNDSLIALRDFGESSRGKHNDALILLDMEGYCRQYNELFNTQSDRQFHGP